MKREDLKKVLELFRDDFLTEDQTLDAIMGNMPGHPVRERGDIDTGNDPVRALVDKQLIAKSLSMKEVSLAIGRNEAYVHQFLTRGSPKRLHERDRPKLAE